MAKKKTTKKAGVSKAKKKATKERGTAKKRGAAKPKKKTAKKAGLSKVKKKTAKKRGAPKAKKAKKKTAKKARKAAKKAGARVRKAAKKAATNTRKAAKKAATKTRKAAKKAATKTRKAAKKAATKTRKVVENAATKTKAVAKQAAEQIGGAAAPEDRPGEGARAPTFSLPDDRGHTVSSASLEGRPYVLYFYPRDDTPGCTKEACGFRDDLAVFRRTGVRVLGVSPDGVASHARFRDKYDLNFSLLSDEDKTLARAYGVWVKKKNYGREYMGIERSTFLVDANGVLRKVWRGVKVPGHVDAVREAAASL